MSANQPRLTPELLVRVRAGSDEAFLEMFVAATAALFRAAESDISFDIGPLHLVTQQDKPQVGLLAASVFLRDLLRQSPNGRKALADLGFEPVLQNVEGK